MKRFLASFLLALFAWSAIAQVPIYTKGPGVLAASGTPSNPFRIAVIGASGSSRNPNLGSVWVNQLEQIINAAGPTTVVVRDFAIGGSSSWQQMNTAVYGSNTQAQEAVNWRPDVIMVSVGFNDTVMNVDGRTLAQNKTDMDALFSFLRTSLPSALIIYIAELGHDNVAFPGATTTLKNKGVVPWVMELPPAGILTACYTSEMLDTVISGGLATKFDNWNQLDAYVRTGPSTSFNVVGANWITGPYFKILRLGTATPDGGHFNWVGHQLVAASVFKQLKTLSAFTALVPRLSTQSVPGWVDPDVLFSYYLTASGDGYVRSGTELVTNGVFAADTNWNKFFGVTIAAGVMAFDGVTSISPAQTFLSPIVAIPITVGQTYFVTYTITVGTTLDISSSLGGVNGTARNAPGTYTDTITAVSTAGVAFIARTSAGARTGSIDNVSITTAAADLPGSNAGEVARFWGATAGVLAPEEWHLPFKTRIGFSPANITTQNLVTDLSGLLQIMVRGGPPTSNLQLSIAGSAFSATSENTDTHGNANVFLQTGTSGLAPGTYLLRFKASNECYGPYSWVIGAGFQQTIYSVASNTSAFTATGANVAGSKDHVLNLTGALGGAANITMPTAANLVAAIPGASPGQTYRLRIINSSSGAFAWTVLTNAGITLTGTMTIAQNTWREFVVTLTSLTAVAVQSVGTGTQS